MKFIDFALIFTALAWCVFSGIFFQENLLEEQIFGNAMYNNIMDNAAEDALRNAVDIENYKPVIDKEKVLSYIVNELADNYMGETKNYREYLKNNIRLIVITYPDGFYMAGRENGKEFSWREKEAYPQGILTKPEEKVNAVLSFGYKEYGVDLFLPNGESTGLINTVEDYQLLLVYETYPIEWHGKKYSKLLLSGARVNHEIDFAL